MEILFISTWFPFPQDNGSRIRVYHLLCALADYHQVHLIAYLPSENERKYLPAVKDICTSVQVAERDPFWRDPKKRLSAHLSLTPRDVLRSHSHQMARLVKKVNACCQPDVVIASTMDAGRYAATVQQTPLILEEHNFTTLWMQERYQAQGDPLRKALSWVTWQKCRRYERLLYGHFQVVSMVSEHDRRAVRTTLPDYTGRLVVIPNGVDLETHQPGLARPQPDTIVFNGSLTYPANLEAMRWFISQVLPLIRRERPKVCLSITGRTAGVDLSWLPDDPRIQLTGHLEDVRQAVAESWLAVAPLRTGSGTRMKILEAMALGTPVVATSKGAEGLEATSGKDVLIADRARDYAAHCLRLLESPTLRTEIAKYARCLVVERYGWQAIGQQFCELVESTAAGYKIEKGFR